MQDQSANCLGASGSPLTRFLSFADHIVKTGKKNDAFAALYKGLIHSEIFSLVAIHFFPQIKLQAQNTELHQI